MPKTIQGHPANINTGLVGIVTRVHVSYTCRRKHIYTGSAANARSGYRAYITTDNKSLNVLIGGRKPRLMAQSHF